MERVAILIHQLQEQLQQDASNDKLLRTTQMLLAELQQKQIAVPQNSKVSVVMPTVHRLYQEDVVQSDAIVMPEPIEPESFIIEEEPVLKMEENMTELPPVFFDTSSIPTLSQQEPKEVFELNDFAIFEENDVNTKLKEHKVEVATVLEMSPIKDLKKAIGINDRYLFINELFRGDETMFDRSVKTIQSFSILPEATFWIERELKIKLGWNPESEAVRAFDQLVKRRFS